MHGSITRYGLAVALCLGVVVSMASGFAFFSGNFRCDPVTGKCEGDAADLVGHPEDIWRWHRRDSELPIRYKFDRAFDRMFDSEDRVKAQVDLAFQEWGRALSAYQNRTRYTYRRSNPGASYHDIRSIALHEIGHTMGLLHPQDGILGYTPARNYRITPSGMSPYTIVNNGEVLETLSAPGKISRFLSLDEVHGYRYAYPALQLRFVRARDFEMADIVVSARDWTREDDPIAPHVIARTVVAGQPRTLPPLEGRWFRDATIYLNTGHHTPIGFKTKAINWDIYNDSPRAVTEVEVHTMGTDTEPVWRYDGPEHVKFTEYESYNWRGLSAEREDEMLHHWRSPIGGSVPAGVTLHVGVELDVWDWEVLGCTLTYEDGSTAGAAPVAVHEYRNEILSEPIPDAGGLGLQTYVKGEVVARGVRITAPRSDINTRITRLGLADVAGSKLRLADLNRGLLNELRSSKRLVDVSPAKSIRMRPGGEFFLILEGTEKDLPKEMVAQGNYRILKRPDLAGKELFVFVETQARRMRVGSFGLINTPVIGSTPR